MRPKIVILDDYEMALEKFGDWETVKQRADITFHKERLVGKELIEATREADVIAIVSDRTEVTDTLVKKAKALKYLIHTGPRNNRLNTEALHARGIPVSYTEEGDTVTSTAELTWALTMAASKRTSEHGLLVQLGRWRRTPTLLPTLRGDRMGIIGVGAIGSRVAQYAKAFGMEVVAWSPNLTDERATEAGVTRVELDELLKTSKVVSLHLVPSPATVGLLGREKLALMREDSILVNTAHSSLIVTRDLSDAMKVPLESETEVKSRPGQIAIDVHDVEPVPNDYCLLGLPNALMSPHTGLLTEDNFRNYSEGVIESLEAWLDGRPLPRERVE